MDLTDHTTCLALTLSLLLSEHAEQCNRNRKEQHMLFPLPGPESGCYSAQSLIQGRKAKLKPRGRTPGSSPHCRLLSLDGPRCPHIPQKQISRLGSPRALGAPTGPELGEGAGGSGNLAPACAHLSELT